MVMAMFAASGVAGMAVMNLQALRLGYAWRLALPYAGVAGAFALAGFVTLVEMLFL